MLQGLGGGSGTGVLFPSVVWSGARTAQSKWGEPPKMSFISGSVFVAFGPLFRRFHLLRETLFHCIIYGDRDLFRFVQARPRPYFFGAGIVGAYFLLAQQNFGTEFSTLEKIWSRSIFDIQTRPRAPYFRTGSGVK